MKEDITLKSVQEIIKQLDALEPLMVFEQPKREDEFAVNESLAKLYADPVMRSYLKNSINKGIVRVALNSSTEKEIWLNTSRVLVLKELYRNAERAFANFSAKKSNPQ